MPRRLMPRVATPPPRPRYYQIRDREDQGRDYYPPPPPAGIGAILARIYARATAGPLGYYRARA